MLNFTGEEIAKLEKFLEAGEDLDEMLESALGPKRVMRSSFLPDEGIPATSGPDYIKTMVFCALDGGLVRASTTEGGQIVRSEIIEGREAWNLFQPFIDP